jgi:hypothetical protein
MACTFAILLLVSVVLPLVESHPALARRPVLSRAMTLPNPLFALNGSFESYYRTAPADFWWSVGVIQGLAWLMLALAAVIVPRAWRDDKNHAMLASWRERWHDWSFGGADERRLFRRRLLNINPFFWLAARERLKPGQVWGFLGLCSGLWLWGLLEEHRDWFDTAEYIITAIVLNTALKLWVAAEAGRRLGEDRKLGAMELLLSTPLKVKDILSGQLLALQRQFFGPLLVVAAVELIFFLASMRDRDLGDSAAAMSVFWAGQILTLATDVLALSWVGMWVGLTARNPNRATGTTVFRVLVAPTIVWIVFWIVLGALEQIIGNHADASWEIVGSWFIFGLAADALLGWTAWRRLHFDFRAAASQQRDTRERRGWLRRRKPAAPVSSPVAAR